MTARGVGQWHSGDQTLKRGQMCCLTPKTPKRGRGRRKMWTGACTPACAVARHRADACCGYTHSRIDHPDHMHIHVCFLLRNEEKARQRLRQIVRGTCQRAVPVHTRPPNSSWAMKKTSVTKLDESRLGARKSVLQMSVGVSSGAIGPPARRSASRVSSENLATLSRKLPLGTTRHSTVQRTRCENSVRPHYFAESLARRRPRVRGVAGCRGMLQR